MKGLIFTEFMEMVESVWSLDMVDRIIEVSRVPSGGVYTSVGNYPHDEIVALVSALSAEIGTPTNELIRIFGDHLFGRFAKAYPRFFDGITDSFAFLSGIESIIHAEVRKLYPDADLPTFEVEAESNRLTLTYFSDHPFADLAQGLIEGCLKHFDCRATLDRVPAPNMPGAQARFILARQE